MPESKTDLDCAQSRSHYDGPRSIDINRVDIYLAEAGVLPADSGSALPGRFIDPIDYTLKFCLLTRNDLDRMESARPEQLTSDSSFGGMEIGIAALGVIQSVELIDIFIRAGGSLAEILVDNVHTLFTETTLHLAHDAMTEVLLGLPGGSVHLGEALVNLAAHHSEVLDVVSYAVEHGVNIIDALEIAGFGVDIVEGVATLGAGILLSWLVKYCVREHFEPIVEDKKAQLQQKEREYCELMKLRSALKLKLPAGVVAAYLGNVDRHHWGF